MYPWNRPVLHFRSCNSHLRRYALWSDVRRLLLSNQGSFLWWAIEHRLLHRTLFPPWPFHLDTMAQPPQNFGCGDVE